MVRTIDVLQYLEDNDVEYDLLTDIPAFLSTIHHQWGFHPAQTVLFQADGYYWLAILSAERRIDLAALGDAVNASDVRIADKTDLNFFYPERRANGLSPFGNLNGFPVIMDRLLTQLESLAFLGCVGTKSLIMEQLDYERLVRPLVADFSESAAETSTMNTVGSAEYPVFAGPD